jgi:hypothetical protein
MADRFEMLDVWQALGLNPNDFHDWIGEPKRTAADAWAQLMGAVAGSVESLSRDTNPPCGELLLGAANRRLLPTTANISQHKPRSANPQAPIEEER